jgi:transcriptional regulator NrdR family protein
MLHLKIIPIKIVDMTAGWSSKWLFSKSISVQMWVFSGKLSIDTFKHLISGQRPNQSTFKQSCPTTSDGKRLVINKLCDRQRHVRKKCVGKAMTQANLQLCMFHVLRNFRSEVSVEKLGISVGEKIRALEILQYIVYSKSDDLYKLHYNKLCNECHRTNNIIESINDKVKSVLKHHSTLPEFAENFLITLMSACIK